MTTLKALIGASFFALLANGFIEVVQPDQCVDECAQQVIQIDEELTPK